MKYVLCLFPLNYVAALSQLISQVAPCQMGQIDSCTQPASGFSGERYAEPFGETFLVRLTPRSVRTEAALRARATCLPRHLARPHRPFLAQQRNRRHLD